MTGMGIPDMWLDDDDRMGWDGVYRHHITASHLHETRHSQQPIKQPTKQTRCNNNNNNILQIHFYDDTPSFEKDNVFFFWMD